MSGADAAAAGAASGVGACAAAVVPFAATTRTIALGLFMFALAYVPCTIVWWVVRRKHTMLRQRSFGLMTITAVAVLAHVAMVALPNYLGRGIPCELALAAAVMAVPANAAPLVSRLLMMYCQYWFYRLAGKERSKGQGSRNLDVLRIVLRHPVGLSLGVFMVSGLLGFLVVIAVPSSTPVAGCVDCAVNAPTMIGLAALLGATTLACAVLQYRLAQLADPFGLGAELTALLVINTVQVAVFGLAVFDFQDLQAERVWDWMLPTSLVSLLVHTAQCPAAVLRTYEYRKRRELKRLEGRPSQRETDRGAEEGGKTGIGIAPGEQWNLWEVLASEGARLVFADYLVSEFAVENLWFYDAVRAFEQHEANLGDAKQLELAQEIVRNFVADGSLLQINISSQIRRAIQDEVAAAQACGARASRGVFDVAKSEVTAIMNSDTFPRFQRSKLYAGLVSAGAVAQALSKPSPA